LVLEEGARLAGYAAEREGEAYLVVSAGITMGAVFESIVWSSQVVE
jgi:hypothetical protein